MTAATARAAAPAAATARRGQLAVIQQRRSYTMMHGPTVAEFVYIPCKVAAVTRDGAVKAITLIDGRRVERRDWAGIEVDTRGMVADVDAVLRQLVETEDGRPVSWPREFKDKAAALAAIKQVAGIEPEQEPATVPSPRNHGTIVQLHPRQPAALGRVDTAAPNAGNGTNSRSAPPRRVTNAERRPREHLSRDEVVMLCKAARQNRYGARDAAAIWIAFNHGLRVSELCDLRWGDVRWEERKIMVRRLKGSASGEHPLTEQDKRFLAPLRGKGQRPSDTVFGMTAAGFRKMLARLELPAELAALKPHPHALRHACGYDMVGRADLQARAAFMGHKRLENTIRYSQLDPDQFEGLRP